MRLNTNVSSLTAQRAVSEHVKDMQSSSGKLSSGQRVRTASDDAASLSIGTQLKSKERSTLQAIRNTSEAVSEFQVAEGAFNELSSMVSRLHELSVQAATDTVDDNQRAMINMEYMQLREEIERVSASTQFNGRQLLRVGANDPTRDFQVGVHKDEGRLSFDSEQVTVNEFKLDLVDSNVLTKTDAQINLGYVKQAVEKLAGQRAYLGSMQNRLNHISSALENDRQQTQTTTSKLLDADLASESAALAKAKMLTQGATAVLGQANNLGNSALKLLNKMS